MEALAVVAPGTPLREGLDRVLQGKRGALVVVGDDPAVLSVCTGGFLLDAEFSPQRLSELAKMDGAIILAGDASRIARANVHLVPRASIPTSETGTRHRTAERVARSIDVTVVTVSEARAEIAVYRNDQKHTIQSTPRLVNQVSQALATMQRFKSRFDLALALLSPLEVEDSVTLRDVVAVLQPGEMLVRMGEEVEGTLVELGEDGRMSGLQLEELTAGVGQSLRLVIEDYVADAAAARGAKQDGRPARVDRVLVALHKLHPDDLLDPVTVGATLGLPGRSHDLDAGLEARGYRLLSRLPRVPEQVIGSIVERFGTLPRLIAASPAELEKVGGIGEARARAVKDGLSRLVEASILERYE